MELLTYEALPGMKRPAEASPSGLQRYGGRENAPTKFKHVIDYMHVKYRSQLEMAKRFTTYFVVYERMLLDQEGIRKELEEVYGLIPGITECRGRISIYGRGIKDSTVAKYQGEA